MSAMSELDLMLKEYEGARDTLRRGSFSSPVIGYLQALENALRAADVLANGLRSMVAANAATTRWTDAKFGQRSGGV